MDETATSGVEKTEKDLLLKEIEKLKTENAAYLLAMRNMADKLLQFRESQSLEAKNERKRQKDCESFAGSSSPIKCQKISSISPTTRLLASSDETMISLSSCDEPTAVIPMEVFLKVFHNLEREDLDNCQLVCKLWGRLIKEKSHRLARRIVRCVKLIEKTSLSLTISTKSMTKKYAYSLSDVQERPDVIFDVLKRFLTHSYLKRIIICNLNLTDEFCRSFSNCMKGLNFPEILRVEMLALNLHQVSPDVFHKFLGQTLAASQYFIDGVRNAMEEHFSSLLFEQAAVRNADDFTVYDVRSLDNEDVVLAVGDDVLLGVIFGSHGLPRRNTLYLDSPDISMSFLAQCLLRFVECEDVDQIISHVEFAHCHEQQVPTLRNITLEYEHNIQVEWSARNRKTGRVMEARVSRNGDDDDFCHLTLSIQTE